MLSQLKGQQDGLQRHPPRHDNEDKEKGIGWEFPFLTLVTYPQLLLVLTDLRKEIVGLMNLRSWAGPALVALLALSGMGVCCLLTH